MTTDETPLGNQPHQPTNAADAECGNINAIRHIAYSLGYADGKTAAFQVFTPAMVEAIYVAWRGSGVDVAGGNWARFVGMLPRA